MESIAPLYAERQENYPNDFGWVPLESLVANSDPMPEETHIFKSGDPYAQILIIPKKPTYEIKEMNESEKQYRKTIDEKIHNSNTTLSKHVWRDNNGKLFDDKYKQLQIAYNKEGMAGIEKLIEEKVFYKKKEVAPKEIKQIGKFVKSEAYKN